MKKFLGIALALVGAVSTAALADDNGSCDCKTQSHTFFNVRPQYQSATPERVTLFRDHPKNDGECAWGADFELVLFGGRSTKAEKLACFLTPFGKETLTVKQTVDASTDIDSTIFNVVTANSGFASTISFSPRQSVIGLGMTYRQALGSICDWSCTSNWWFEISSPLERVKNQMELSEVVTNNGGGVATITGLPAGAPTPVANMIDAYKQAAFLFGRINNDDSDIQKTTKLGDVELKVGYEWLKDACCGAESWVGILAPTGNKVKGVNVFEPIVGHNRHWGIMMGFSAYFQIYESDCWNAMIYLDQTSKYLFKRSEVRSFDLKYKPYSRYMPVYANFAQAEQAEALLRGSAAAAGFLSTPGINVFTQELNVKPRFSHTMNIALAFDRNCWEAELGYNFFGRDAECVSLKNPWATTYAIKAAEGAGVINPFRQVNNQVNDAAIDFSDEATYNANTIKASDLNLESAAHPAIIAHTVYGSLGYNWDDACSCYPMFFGIGGSYEFNKDNNTLDRYNVWGKFGVSF